MNEFINKDCFSYNKGKCTALNDLYCKYEECRFYKKKDTKVKGGGMEKDE